MATALSTTVVGHKALTALGAPTAGDVTGNTITNSGGHTLLYIENTGATARTLGVSFGRTVDGQAVTAWSFAIAASTKYLLKLGSVADYGSTVTITPSHAEVAVKVFELT